MRKIEVATKFKRDRKREIAKDTNVDALLQSVIELLVADALLPLRLSDHGLSGPWKGCRDCHVKPDLVLIYEKPDGLLRLIRLGSHSDLFR